jgi:hypothetical protein
MHIRHGIVVMVLLPIFLSLVFLPSPPSSHTHTIKMQSLWRCEGNTMSHISLIGVFFFGAPGKTMMMVPWIWEELNSLFFQDLFVYFSRPAFLF